LLGGTLVIAAFGVSEAIRRYWPQTHGGGALVRELALLVGLATLLPFSMALGGMFSLSGNAGTGIFALFPLVACAVVRHRQQSTGSGQRARFSLVFQLAVGVLVLAGGAITCESSEYFPSALAIAGLALLAMAARVRIWNVLVAGALPVLGGFVWLWQRLLSAQPHGLAQDSINLAVLLLISVGLAILLWKKIGARRLRKAAFWGDALLHSLGIFSLHLFFQKHLGEGPDFLAAGLLGLSLFAVSLRFPFRALGALSWLPVALACAAGIVAGNWHGVRGGESWFVAAALLILAHLLIADHFRKRPPLQDSGFEMSKAASFIAVFAWTLITLAAAESPWQAAVLTGVALLCSVLWRWRSIVLLGHLGLGPLTLAFWMAATLMLAESFAPGPLVPTLMSILLTSAGIAANGMIMASAVRHILGGKITSASMLPWVHAVAALLLVFVACTIDRLVSDNLTAVFWGLSAILLFVSGLFAGLRAYRFTGLIGLVLCIGHIFIWDIQDTFYRIIAFFVIGLAMLAIGFLYHRFRERITALDS
jgi:phage-related holin